MTLGLTRSLPRWLIDDTSDVSNARIFCMHTQSPMFIGELLPEEEAELSGLEIVGLPAGQVLTHITFLHKPCPLPDDLARSLTQAIQQHDAVRHMDS